MTNSSLTIPLVLQLVYPSSASDGYAPYPRSTLSCVQPSLGSIAPTGLLLTSHACFFYSPSSCGVCQFISPLDAHVHRTAAFCSRLSRGCGGKFEQVRSCVRWAHGQGILGQRTPHAGACSWCRERHGAFQEKFQVGACVLCMSPGIFD